MKQSHELEKEPLKEWSYDYIYDVAKKFLFLSLRLF